MLWPTDPPRDVRNAVQTQVSRLRRALGPLVTEGSGYRLALPPGCLDAGALEAAVVAARQGQGDAAAGRLRAALTAWRGDPLADAADDPEVVVAAARLEELRLEAYELLAETTLAAGDGAELIGELRALACDHPRRERLHRALALTLYRAGRQDETLAVLQTLQTGLRDELGVDPAPDTVALERRILQHDPALSGRARQRRGGVRRPERDRAGRGRRGGRRVRDRRLRHGAGDGGACRHGRCPTASGHTSPIDGCWSCWTTASTWSTTSRR